MRRMELLLQRDMTEKCQLSNINGLVAEDKCRSIVRKDYLKRANCLSTDGLCEQRFAEIVSMVVVRHVNFASRANEVQRSPSHDRFDRLLRHCDLGSPSPRRRARQRQRFSWAKRSRDIHERRSGRSAFSAGD
jgi:hypothetical protein